MTSSIFSRRNLLLGGAGVGVTTLGVGGYAAAASEFDFFKAMLRAELPGVIISDESIRIFSQDAMSRRNDDFGPKLKAISAMTRVLGFKAVADMLSDNHTFEKFHRDVLTKFLLGSNFFMLPDPTAEEVLYIGPPGACAANPFAQFEPPA
jgi:hypothetical protein